MLFSSAILFIGAHSPSGLPCVAPGGARRPMPELAAAYPPYTPPFVRGLRVQLSAVAGFALRDAWLQLDDKGAGAKTERALIAAGGVAPNMCAFDPSGASTQVTFDLPLFRTGENGFRVRGVLERDGELREVSSRREVVDYRLPDELGVLAPGVFRLPADFPMRAGVCPNDACKDADGDGLNDLWENVASTELRPLLHLDADDALFDGARHDQVRLLSSVMPRHTARGDYVLFSYVILFSRDYGFLGLGFDHPGDTEAFAMLFKVEPDSTLRWEHSIARGHRCLTCSPRYTWNEQEFTKRGTPVVYVERDKHGLWSNGRACRADAAFRCRGQRKLRPSSFNVGDFTHDGPRALVDRLDGNVASGPFADLAFTFPGEAIWTPASARVAGRFCGGMTADCTAKHSASQPGAIFAGMLAVIERAGF